MLQVIRDKTTGWIAVAVVGLLCIPFAFWGINYYFQGGSEPVVATVNGDEIKFNEFQRSYSNYRQQMQEYLGKNLTAAEEDALKEETLKRMVESKLLDQVAESFGLQISDKQVKQAIKGIEVFQTDGKFDNALYQMGLMRLGMSPALYEYQMRLDMMSEQIQTMIVESEISTMAEARKAAALARERRDIRYSIIPVDRFRDDIEVTEDDIESFYKEYDTRYYKPEEVSIAYINLSMAKLAERVEVSEDALREYYESNKASYDTEEQRKITQILIKIEEGSSDDQIASAESEAQKILGMLESGKTFEDIAKLYAEDSSNFSLTEYGFLPKGILQPEIDEVVFSMKPETVSGVIKSKLGFHIVKLVDMKGGVLNTFENNREQVEADYRQQESELRFYDLADQLANLTFEHPDNLEVAASETDLPVENTQLFDRNGTEEGPGSYPKIVEAAFSEEVLDKRHNSELIEVADGNLYVIRVTEHSPRMRLSIADVRDTIIEDIKSTRASEETRSLGMTIIEELASGKAFAAIEKDHDIKWEKAESVKRGDIEVNRAVLRTAFTMGKPEEGSSVFDGIQLGSGDYAIIAVTGVETLDPESIKGKDAEDTKRTLETFRAANSWVQFLDQLKAEADINLFKDVLQ
ncbi:MAG TPA: SurA N-terminal domain-containing protein [Gammaproteobacteria bacterium]